MISLAEVFAANGPLARARGGLEPRPGQIAMAHAVERGLLESMHVLVEAGTGVGKSFAYLAPMLRSGKKVVISTGTVALQERLLEADIPFVARALGYDPKIAILKGRNHYLCRDKYNKQTQGALLAPSETLDALWNWAYETESGDRAELPFVPPAFEWESLNANADECIGEHCAEFTRCHYFRARTVARDAQIVVVNHALFFLDLVRGGLLPPYDAVVLDEAHQCEHWATAALTGVLSERTVGRALRRLRSDYHFPADFDVATTTALRSIEAVAADVPSERYALRFDSADDVAARTAAGVREMRKQLRSIEVWLENDGMRTMRHTRDEEERMRRTELRLREIRWLIAVADSALTPTEAAVSWIERSDQTAGVHTAPYDVAPFLRERLFSRIEHVTLTSATLAEGTSFAFLRRNLGIDTATEAIVASPFRFATQARLYTAPARVNPKSAQFEERAGPIVLEALLQSRGRAFVLFTSHARMRRMVRNLREHIPYPVRAQGDAHPAALLRWFSTTPGAVLFATGAFWEGIDVAGSALSCVIVDRLPFPSPADPLVAARIAALERRGIDAFRNYMVPAAIARLKQGFGRLIRSANDRGALVLLDGRGESTDFGKTIIEALPAAKRIESLFELAAFFNERDTFERVIRTAGISSTAP